MTSSPHRHRARGFTLIESMIAVAIAAILAGLAVPSFRGLLLDARRTAVVNDFVTAVNLARSEVQKRNRHVVVCGDGGAGQCAQRDWNGGWLVFVNLDRDEPPRRDPDEPLVGVFGKAASTVRVSANRSAFVFRPFHLNATNGTATFCDERGPTRARAVIVSNSGRARTAPASGARIDCP